MKKIVPFLTLVLTFFLLVSCSNKIVFDKKVFFPDANWTFENKEQTFEVSINDLKIPYSIIIELDLVGAQNVDKFLASLSILSPNGGESVRKMTFNFKNPQEPFIQGVSANEKIYKLIVYPKRYFSESGVYTFIVSQHSHKADNYGIRSLRLYVEKLKETK
jgi:gliding motility-associated lipoprotein GldH